MSHIDLHPEARPLFIATTPYHLMLTLALLEQYRIEGATVVFIDDAHLLKQFSGIRDLLAGHDFITLPAREVGAQQSGRVWRAWLTGRRLAERFRTLTHVVVFNDSRSDVQALLVHVPNTVRYCMCEDGLEAYLEGGGIKSYSQIKRLATFVYPFYKATHLFGEYRPVDAFFLLQPDAARSSIRQEVRRLISHKAFGSSVARMRRVVVAGSSGAPQPFAALVLGTLSEAIQDMDEYLDHLRGIVTEARMDHPDGTVAVKLHPRERDTRLKEAVERIEGVHLLPQQAPLEVFSNDLTEDCTIYAGLTTFILTSKVLRPRRRVVLKADTKGLLDEALVS